MRSFLLLGSLLVGFFLSRVYRRYVGRLGGIIRRSLWGVWVVGSLGGEGSFFRGFLVVGLVMRGLEFMF